MNELLAIIIIVLACCAMFIAWLVSMATCPDRMVNLIGGPSTKSHHSSAASSSSRESSKERAVDHNEEGNGQCNGKPPSADSAAAAAAGGKAPTGATTNQNGSLLNQLLGHASQRRLLFSRSTDKKLSVVPEQDEPQLTVSSITQALKGMVTGRHPSGNGTTVAREGGVGGVDKPKVISLAKIRNERLKLRGDNSTGSIKEERCVEDVISSRRRKHQSGDATVNIDELDESAEDADDDGEEEEPGSASDITPVASRCPTPVIHREKRRNGAAWQTSGNDATLELGGGTEAVDQLRHFSHSDPLLMSTRLA